MLRSLSALPPSVRIVRPGILAISWVLIGSSVFAQQIRFPTPQATDPYYPGATGPGVGMTPWGPAPSSVGPVAPGPRLNGGNLPFDPYASPSQSMPSVYGGGSVIPPAVPQVLPPVNSPYGYPNGEVPRVMAPTYPGGGTAPANVPPAIPGGNGANVYGANWGYDYSSPLFPEGMPWSQTGGPYQRLFQDTGARYTYLWGGDEDDQLEIHELELSTSLVFQNFARSATGLRITPGFIFDFVDGPNAGAAADLPAQLYSAYLDAAWRPQITPQFAADLRVRPGVYSDFESVTGHSLRITGHAVGVVQLTPTSALKLGIEYLDREKIKLFPAVGVYWEPNPQTRVDIYFPRPKIARYWGTSQNREFWWHIGAEYGGGSWVIDRVDDPLRGRSERIDINDIRIFTGVDWSYLDQRTGFIQIGYVFDRKLVIKLVPSENLTLDDTFMIRGGLRF